jgi:1-acyl-sn-glycerol-3-phosphate acyltransferase
VSRESRRRRAFGGLVSRLAGLMTRIFFREIETRGLEQVPRDRPLLIVANHTNSIVDALLLLALPGCEPRFLAKSTLFGHPFLGPLLRLAGALPVYRRVEGPVDLPKNLKTFARCHESLAAGDSIALFPEGTSHSQPRRLALKTGAARIVLGAESRLGPLGVRIVPVSLRYEAKQRFRTRVRIGIGAAIDPGTELERYAASPQAAVRELTERIAGGLDAALPDAAWPAVEPTARSWRRDRVRHLLARAIAPVGWLLNWLPYSLPGWVANRFSKSPDDPATYKMLTALLAFPLVWTLESGLALWFGGPALGLAMAVAAPSSGYVALVRREGKRSLSRRRRSPTRAVSSSTPPSRPAAVRSASDRARRRRSSRALQARGRCRECRISSDTGPACGSVTAH